MSPTRRGTVRDHFAASLLTAVVICLLYCPLIHCADAAADPPRPWAIHDRMVDEAAVLRPLRLAPFVSATQVPQEEDPLSHLLLRSNALTRNGGTVLAAILGDAGGNCTTLSNCSNHASTVVFDNATGTCQCTCVHQWLANSSCSVCPAIYNQSQNCSVCAADRNASSYPSCTVPDRACTIELDCNPSFTTRVSGTTATGCVCTCKNQAVAPRCDCPAKYEQNPDAACRACAFGYDATTYPNCYKKCTVVANCSSNAVSVAGNYNTGCTCKCMGGWQTDNCSYCPPNYDEASDCIQCAEGYSPFNNTCVSCGLDYCNYHASSFYPSSETGCVCVCASHWSGPRCSMCPIEYDEANDCQGCNTAGGFVDRNGECFSICSIPFNCSNHATAAEYNATTNTCRCTCAANWNGTTCDVCTSPLYDPNQNCAKCREGLTNFPYCNVTATTTTTTTTTTTVPNTTTTLSPNATTTTAPPSANTTTTTTMPPTTTTLPPTPPPKNRTRTNTSTVSAGHLSRSNHSWTPSLSQTPTGGSNTTALTPSRDSRSLSDHSPSLSATHSRDRNSTSLTLTQDTATPSMSHPTLTRPSPSLSASLCAVTVEDCTFRTNHSLTSQLPAHCMCACRNNWTTMFCEYCHPRFNASDDCGSCTAPYYRMYPKCDYSVYVTGNWTIPLEQPTLMGALVRSLLFQSLAEDLAAFLDLPQVNCTKKAFNVSAYVIDWVGLYPVDRVSRPADRDTTVVFDVDIMDPDPFLAKAAARCIVDALQTQQQRQWLTFPNASRIAAALQGAQGEQHLASNPNYYFGSGGGIVQLSPALNYSLMNPCAPKWCATLAPIVDPPAAAEDHTGAIIGGVVGALLLIGAALAAYLLWFRPRRVFAASHVVRDERDVDYRRLRDVDALEMNLMLQEADLHLQQEEDAPKHSSPKKANGQGTTSQRQSEKEFHLEGDEMASVRMFVH